VIEIEAEGTEWKVESIIASSPSVNAPKKHVYIVTSEGFSLLDNTLETYENMLECSFDLVKYHYAKDPTIEPDSQY